MKRDRHIFELSHDYRKKIVELCLERPKKHTELKKILDISPAEMTRHLKRVTDSGFVKKTPEAKYEITSYGKLLFQQLKYMEFIANHHDLFEKYDLSAIPDELRSMAVISIADVISDPLSAMETLFTITSSAKIFLWSISSHPVEPFIMEKIDKLNKGVELRIMYQRGDPLPSNLLGKSIYPFDLKTLDEIPLSIWLNEKMAIVVLPTNGCVLDYSIGLRSERELFLRWSEKLFDYFWEIGDYVSR